MTLRDNIWNTALENLVENGKFRVSDIIDDLDEADNSQRKTVQRCLRQLEDKGWLERKSTQSPIWRLGWKGRMLLNISEDKVEQAKA